MDIEVADPRYSFLADGGRMGALIRAFDWSRTPLGPPQTWPAPLRTVVRILLTTNHPVFVFWGRDLICLYNDAYSRSLGPEKDPYILGAPGRDSWAEIWHIIGPQIEQVMEGGGATWHENHLVPILRHGVLDQVYWTYSFGPIDDERAAHGVGGVLVLCTETTAQVLAQQHLRAAESRWRALFDLAPGFVCVLDGPDYRYEYANPKYLRLVGRDAVIGHTVEALFPEVRAQGFIDLLDNVYRSGAPYVAASVPLTLSPPNGDPPETQYIDFVYQPIKDAQGEVTGIFVEGADVTERVNAELALRASENRFRIMADGVPVIIWVTSADGEVEFVNREYSEYYRTTYDEVRREGWERFVHAEDLVRFKGAFANARASASRFNLRTRVRHASGSWRWIDNTAVPRFDADGTYLGHVGSGIDVTELVASQEALAETGRRKDDFLAVLSHELRNPLAAILSASNLVTRSGAEVSESIRWAAAIIERQASSMAQLLNDLLDISRITRGVLSLKRERARLAAVIESALEVTRPAIERKRHALAVSLPEEEVALDVDPLRITQAVGNLLSNAAKYTDEGGSLQLSARVQGREVCIALRDNGIGMTSESLPRLFQMFAQVTSHADRSEGGLGIGLALVKGIAEIHGGRVEAFSEGLGRGSEFRIWLPIAGDRHATEVPAVAVARAARRPCRILIADDNADAAEMLAVIVRDAGHDVRVAHDGSEALRIARDFGPDIAFLDIGMPGLTGYDVSVRMCEDPQLAGTRLIAVSGWGQAEDKRKAKDAGFDLHLTKPVVASALFSIIDRVP